MKNYFRIAIFSELYHLQFTEAAVRRCSVKMLFSKSLEILQRNTCGRVLLLLSDRLESYNFTKIRLCYGCFLANLQWNTSEIPLISWYFLILLQTFRHLLSTLHLKWLPQVFNCIATNHQTATRWAFPPLGMGIWLIVYGMLISDYLRV